MPRANDADGSDAAEGASPEASEAFAEGTGAMIAAASAHAESESAAIAARRDTAGGRAGDADQDGTRAALPPAPLGYAIPLGRAAFFANAIFRSPRNVPDIEGIVVRARALVCHQDV